MAAGASEFVNQFLCLLALLRTGLSVYFLHGTITMINRPSTRHWPRVWVTLGALLMGCALMPSTAQSQTTPTNYCAYPVDTGGGQVPSTGPTASQTTIGNYEVYGISTTNTKFLLQGHSWDLFEQVTSGPLSTDPGAGNRTTIIGNWYTFAKTPDYTTTNNHTYPTWYSIQPVAGSAFSGTAYTTTLIAVSYSGKFNAIDLATKCFHAA